MKWRVWRKVLLCGFGTTVWKWIQINFTFFLVIKRHHVDIWNEKLSSMCSENFFEVKIVNKLTLEEHVEGLCKKAIQKVSAVARIWSLMRFEKRKRIVDLFIISYFSYNPLVWMFHSRRLNNRIDHIHERALKIIYQDYNSSFIKGCVRYIFASLFCMSKREYYRNKEKCFLFHCESSSRSWDNQLLTF